MTPVEAFSAARDVITSGLATRAFPAAAIDVGRRSGPLWREAFGRLTYAPDAAPCDLETIFDLASLTKVIATATAAMRLVEAGRLTLDQRVGDMRPPWRASGRDAVTVRHLLDHSSGLPAHVRFWEHARGREAVGGVPLDHQFAGVASTVPEPVLYRPGPDLTSRIAPTEDDPWRGHVLRGEVHDENAAALGGVAGHAGLFGTAGGVAAFARLVLETFERPTILVSPALMRLFAARTGVPDSSRALGWDTMRPASSCGTRLSPTAIGHTGFTGTSLWIDHERDLYVVFLTNRVHPTRSNEQLAALRPRVHDAIVEGLG